MLQARAQPALMSQRTSTFITAVFRLRVVKYVLSLRVHTDQQDGLGWWSVTASVTLHLRFKKATACNRDSLTAVLLAVSGS